MEMYYYNIWEVLDCTPYSSENNFSTLYKRLNNPTRFFKGYEEHKETWDLLLEPLMLRWNDARCILHVSERVYTRDELDSSSFRTQLLQPILIKLGLVMYNKVREYDLLNTVLYKDSFDTKATNKSTSVNRSNDTPNAIGNYSADEYTSNINQATNTSETSQSTNEYQTYDIISSRIRTLQQEIINEMKGFEIWI